MKKLKAALLGAGNRGQIYCDYALRCPDELEVVAVVDINPFKMDEAGDKYGIEKEMRFTDLDAFIAQKVACDFVVNATMDEMHYETAMKLIEAGYNLILEKPITGKLEELLDIEKAAKRNGVKVLVCHVLRYTPFYRSIKELIDSGHIGKVMNMQLNEHVWYGHFVNSYVRGKWRSEKMCGSGLLLAKCCHDTDLICWLNNVSAPTKVSSFGSKSFFTEKNAPEGATQYCYECPQRNNCMFDAYKFQIEKDFIPFYTWADLNKPLDDITLEEKIEFLKHDVYGQCVYKTDMDIVDRQCVSVEFENGSIATLNMVGGASKAGRHIHVICEYGEVVGYIEENKYVVRVFDQDEIGCKEEVVDLNQVNSIDGEEDNSVAGHYGGDHFMMKDAVRYFNGVCNSVSVTKIEDSLNGHYVCYAAEISRKEKKVVDLNFNQ
ncbi:MAG: Gfo/Idh/MocA family oxidoreductase [Clostridia bacterium]|nr:Gfo/Idh/MocA family oxidoreductase [Clostridia bacterium]